jgi:GNAT superfamily N-acetyltransferase
MTELDIRPVEMETALRLRMQLSEPPRSREAAMSVGDTAPAAIHLGAFLEDRLVGVGSVGPEPVPVLSRRDAWRLRGLIVLPSEQRKGIGRELVRALLARIDRQFSAMAWCYAKPKLISYYGGCGMRPTGYTYEHPVGGPTLLFGNDQTRDWIHRLTGVIYSERDLPVLGVVEA